LEDRSRDSIIDVFFIHPTTYWGDRDKWNADINDAGLNRKTDYSSILYQASAFNRHARVFAPRYRQVHLTAFYKDSQEVAPYFDTAYADLRSAFVYYLKQFNKGRPFIIAGHSQGAMMSEFLLREFVDGKPLQNQLVAAYIIGWPVMPGFFTKLEPCATPIQTGCFCTWRTFRKGYRPSYVKKEKNISFVTNPLSWTTDTSYAPAMLNAGSVLKNFNRIIPATTGAAVYNGVLWIDKPKFPGGYFYWTRNYHIGDINLFYMNVRQNIEARIRYYRSQYSDK
jgi:hypothetical protein